MSDQEICSHCGQPTPVENLNCIYCGERLGRPVGFLSSLASGRTGWAGLILLVLLLLFSLLWLL
ncbi:MAG: hypothetical protein U9N73_09065 [Candidatus Auribacterota bacterium]|nr:hypothetical protein [Candidatus Auribacterota bacterium]